MYVLRKTFFTLPYFLKIPYIHTWNKDFFMPPVKLLLMISSEKKKKF